MKSPYGFIKTAGRGSAYHTKGGRFWIIKVKSKWHLVQMGNKSEGVEKCTLGAFSTLTATVEYFKKEVAE